MRNSFGVGYGGFIKNIREHEAHGTMQDQKIRLKLSFIYLSDLLD
jgi:hypothetical protein